MISVYCHCLTYYAASLGVDGVAVWRIICCFQEELILLNREISAKTRYYQWSRWLPWPPFRPTPIRDVLKEPMRWDVPKDLDTELATSNLINPLSTDSALSSQESAVRATLESEAAATPLTVPEEQPLHNPMDADADNLFGSGCLSMGSCLETPAECQRPVPGICWPHPHLRGCNLGGHTPTALSPTGHGCLNAASELTFVKPTRKEEPGEFRGGIVMTRES